MPDGHVLFEQDADEWWSKNSHCALLHSIVPARRDYLQHVFTEKLHKALAGATVLDIGCGGGLFAEEVARLGCQVTGIDPSARSIAVAQQHAEQMGLTINYRVASGEQLPFDDDAFDMVYCCDVLEHVHDVNAVVDESARVLKTGGMYLYDTINRTWFSKFFLILLFQKWAWSRIVPSNLHDGSKFIKPKELLRLLRRHGLEPRDMVGLSPNLSPMANLKRMVALWKFRRGAQSYAELGRTMVFRISRFTWLNYMGYAVRNA
jgi:2-polyprenyl-6-hydroxyphenyl methylase/3-demethylubiquinone-9 3-methyltransferase